MSPLQIAGGVTVAVIVGLVLTVKILKGNEYERRKDGR
jgi:hypothetical protein